MKLKIGFTCESAEKRQEEALPAVQGTIIPRKSVVQVQFKESGCSYAYYNDLFDLQEGDLVYVEGKMEGKRGRVVGVNYNFKIKLSDYKRVIAQIDTSVKGKFHFAGTHFVTFDRNAIPVTKVSGWFKAPANEEEEFVSNSDESFFRLDDLKSMQITPEVAERGHKYYVDNKVVYLCLDGDRGYAIVEGSEAYEVEFTYDNGEISRLTCSCFCSYNCKHAFAAMLQLRETLERIEKNYANEFERTDYFAAVFKGTLFSFAVDSSDVGSISLN